MSRSTWARELKSWYTVMLQIFPTVALHVSAWVEICSWESIRCTIFCRAPRERVSWNLVGILRNLRWFQSRSTWARELKFFGISQSHTPRYRRAPRERVSWNLYLYNSSIIPLSRAPRERVSWNAISDIEQYMANRSRSTWARELKSGWYYFRYFFSPSRSTWARELKLCFNR